MYSSCASRSSGKPGSVSGGRPKRPGYASRSVTNGSGRSTALLLLLLLVTRMRMRPLFRVRRMVGVGLTNNSTKIFQRSGGGSLLLRARSLELHFP